VEKDSIFTSMNKLKEFFSDGKNAIIVFLTIMLMLYVMAYWEKRSEVERLQIEIIKCFSKQA
jgi:hypothetical protein